MAPPRPLVIAVIAILSLAFHNLHQVFFAVIVTNVLPTMIELEMSHSNDATLSPSFLTFLEKNCGEKRSCSCFSLARNARRRWLGLWSQPQLYAQVLRLLD